MKTLTVVLYFFIVIQVSAQRKNKHNTDKVQPKQKTTVVKNVATTAAATIWDTLYKLPDSITVTETYYLLRLDFISGTVYFSIPGNNSILVVSLKPRGNAEFYDSYARCVPGSKIFFEKVKWNDANGRPSKPLLRKFILNGNL